MPFPNFDGKHAHDAMVNPEDLLRWRTERGVIPLDLRVPEAVIVTYQPPLYEAAVGAEATSDCAASPAASLRTMDQTRGRVGVLGKFGFGAPIAAVMLEELICLGTTRFLSIGAAGSLQPSLAVGEIVLCDAAVRDEGVSHHYLPPATYATPVVVLDRGIGAGVPRRRRPSLLPRLVLDRGCPVSRDRRGGSALPGSRRSVRRDGGRGGVRRW